MAFSLEKFEAHVYRREHEAALHALLSLLHDINQQHGDVGARFQGQRPSVLDERDTQQHVWTRVASAVSALFADAAFHIPSQWLHQALANHRWIAPIFAASAFGNADHVMRTLNRNAGEDLANLALANRDLLKFCLLYSAQSDVPLNLEALWQRDKPLAAGLCLALLSPRFMGSRAAHEQREKLLPWLAGKLWEIEDLDQLPIDVLHAVYMNCSYATLAAKHDIKKPINALIARRIRKAGLDDLDTPAHAGPGKPVLLVLVEWFNSGHSIHRTHSLSIQAARAHFHVVGIGYDKNVDAGSRDVFDEFVALQPGPMQKQLAQIRAESARRCAQVFYMPSVGMAAITMYAANLRMAPLQVMGLGHPATAHARAIDYVVVEDDYVGDAGCFSEKLLRLPPEGMPYRPSAALTKTAAAVATIRATPPAVVNIALCATTMKLNPAFLEACSRIAERSAATLHFHFLLGDGTRLIHALASKLVRQYLGERATVHPRQPYDAYLQVVAGCDMFLNPFPFGNTNGIVDTIGAGLVGVCKTGAEVHERIDEGLFRRFGLPDWLVARSVDEYVEAALRLANDHAERSRLQRELAGPDKLQVLFEGRPGIMGQRLLALLAQRGAPARAG
ncbi:peptide transporter [Herbaspirillum sp. WKF16]|uniref:peptide transporter n=1 Tax=Herbaspirillum sp. WKF16 TaxID=3028312 RepID=UPI0023A94EBA|nr:peptide transporter [Herbaspirillum sp. WKF16]WDZ96916.1 peptide transporter [Herbaspirillum sp. WKF16]